MKKLTVADILQLDILKNVTICAGSRRPVSFCHRHHHSRRPGSDPVAYRRRNSSYLSVRSRDRPLSFKEYIDTLASKHISALFIKTGERMPQIPAEITQSGSHYGIPIVQLPLM